MSSFGQQYISNTYGTETLRDYAHAPKFFRANSLEYVPRVKFLFHVYFNLNTDPQTGIPALRNVFSEDQTTIGLLVKTIQLPQFNIATEVLNQYNRKRVIQKKVEYNPVQVEMHDDGGDLIRTLWYNYFSYYYKDPNQPYNNVSSTNGAAGVDSSQAAGFSYNNRDIYVNNRTVNDWGYIGESFNDGTNAENGKPAFFRDITIYGFDQHKWVSYVLVNPLISTWNHDTYDYSQDGGIMQNTMTIQYETVKYYSGAIGAERPDVNVVGFADPATYDQIVSPLSTRAQTSTVNGQGGNFPVGEGSITDSQATATESVLGNVKRADIDYNLRMAPPVPTNTNPLAAAGRVNNLRNGLAGQNRPQPNQTGTTAPLIPTPPLRRQFSPTTGVLGGGSGSDLPISA
jgi:hypothetical protein